MCTCMPYRLYCTSWLSWRISRGVVARHDHGMITQHPGKKRTPHEVYVLMEIGARMVKVGTGKCGDGNGTGLWNKKKTIDISFRVAISRPFSSLFSVPSAYHPAVKFFVPVIPSRRLFRSRLCPAPSLVASCSHPMPTFAHSFSHPACQCWGSYSQPAPFATRFVCCPFSVIRPSLLMQLTDYDDTVCIFGCCNNIRV